MKNLQSWLSYLFFAVGAGALGLAAYLYYAPNPGPAVFAETDFTISGSSGQISMVKLRLENRSSRPIRVLGITEC